MAISFDLAVKQFKDDALGNANKVKRAAGLTLFKAIIKDTVVDTGALRGNWRTNIGSANLATEDSRRESQAIGEAVSVTESSKLKDAIHFSNNMHYAQKIEYLERDNRHGQMSHAMVRQNVAKWQQMIDAAIRVFYT
jgi:hypothetical protein